MAAIFREGKIFGKLQRVHSLDTLWVENFDEIALSRTVKEIEGNLAATFVLPFLPWQKRNSKILCFAKNGRHFWEGKIFGKLHRLHSLDTLWVKNSVEIALSLTVSEILANYSKVVLKIHNEVPKWLLLMY